MGTLGLVNGFTRDAITLIVKKHKDGGVDVPILAYYPET